MEQVIKLKQVLKRELKARNQSITSLAKSCGIPTSVLHGWVGGTTPSAKNLHMLKKLAEYLEMPISVLLFNASDDAERGTILFTSEFVDEGKRYKLTVEKMKS